MKRDIPSSFTQTFTLEELDHYGLGWLRSSPIAELKVELKEVTE